MHNNCVLCFAGQPLAAERTGPVVMVEEKFFSGAKLII